MLSKTSTTPLVPWRALFVVYILFVTVHLLDVYHLFLGALYTEPSWLFEIQ